MRLDFRRATNARILFASRFQVSTMPNANSAPSMPAMLCCHAEINSTSANTVKASRNQGSRRLVKDSPDAGGRPASSSACPWPHHAPRRARSGGSPRNGRRLRAERLPGGPLRRGSRPAAQPRSAVPNGCEVAFAAVESIRVRLTADSGTSARSASTSVVVVEVVLVRLPLAGLRGCGAGTMSR